MDEIANAKEVAAVKDIGHRGVAMVATGHGTTLKDLLNNPILTPLVGGKQSMTSEPLTLLCKDVMLVGVHEK